MTLYSAAITLILVMDPLGNIPLFLSILRKFDPHIQTKIIVRETCIAFFILLAFLFFGPYILRSLHISMSALSISGGIILFLIAIRMIFPPDRVGEQDVSVEDPFIVPLAVPLTAGPSAIATVLLFATQEPNLLWTWFAAVILASAIFLLIMISSRFLIRILGRRGLIAMERLMGMILTTVAVQMFITGMSQYWGTVNSLNQ
jgi:multiple antibiotic resistance protein